MEQSLTSHLSLIAGYSHAFGHELTCSDFAGRGLYAHLGRAELGFYTDYAHGPIREFATELTARFSFANYCYLQPVLHLLATDGHFQSVFALRFGVEY